jgi:hypothetical protein
MEIFTPQEMNEIIRDLTHHEMNRMDKYYSLKPFFFSDSERKFMNLKRNKCIDLQEIEKLYIQIILMHKSYLEAQRKYIEWNIHNKWIYKLKCKCIELNVPFTDKNNIEYSFIDPYHEELVMNELYDISKDYDNRCYQFHYLVNRYEDKLHKDVYIDLSEEDFSDKSYTIFHQSIAYIVILFLIIFSILFYFFLSYSYI